MRNVTRQSVVDASRSWIGTPYHHKARVKGSGVDCGQLIIAAFTEAGAVPDIETGPYTPDWHLHRDEERYLGFVEQHLLLVNSAKTMDGIGSMLPGQVLVWRVGRTFSHGALVTTPETFVHASHPAKVVEEIAIAGCFLLDRVVRLYDYPGYTL